ncbi:MAG: hypothetical protein ACR2F6_00275, partial [Mycobacteriales bacterium]
AMLTGIALGAGIAGHVVDTAGTTWALSITTLAGLVAVCVSVGSREVPLGGDRELRLWRPAVIMS